MSENSSFVGQGTYGCVYRKPLPCENCNRNSTRKNTIGKVFSSSPEKNDEKTAYMNISKTINTNNIFTPKFYKECNIANLSEHDKIALKSCQLYPTIRTGSPQLILEDGGVDLSSSINDVSFFEILQNAGNIFGGLVKMEEKRYSHNDIKEANIVYNKNTKRLLLIDFGMMTKYEDITNIPYWAIYPYYPPEFQIYTFVFYPQISEKFKLSPLDDSYKKNVSETDINRLIQKFKRKCRQKFKSPDKKYLEILEILNSFSENARMEKIISFLEEKNEKLKTKKEISDYFQNHANKIDIYSFGITLLRLMSRKIHEVAKNLENDIKTLELISMMIDPNPDTRITPKKALDFYKKHVLSTEESLDKKFSTLQIKNKSKNSPNINSLLKNTISDS